MLGKTPSAVRTLFLAALVLAFLPGCKKKKPGGPQTRTAAEARAAKFAPVAKIVKGLPTSPPPVGARSIPDGARLSLTDALGDNDPKPYLVVHLEDLAAPDYYARDKVKVRMPGTGVLSGCTSGAKEVADKTNESFSEYTLKPCTAFTHAFVIRTTEHVPAKKTGSTETKTGNTRNIETTFEKGHVAGDVTIYDLKTGAAAGGFTFYGVSSDVPSLEGGTEGALERDLVKRTAEAIMDGYTGANAKPAPSASAPKPAAKKK